MNQVEQSNVSESLILNVAIIPPDYVTNGAVELSKKVYALGGIFELDHGTRFPHVTIFMARFQSFKIESVQSALSAIIPTLEKGILNHVGYYMTPHKYYEVSYAKTAELGRTQEVIAKELREFRYSPGNPVIENYFGEYEGEIKESVERCGYDLTGNLYRPHLTLTRFPVESQIDHRRQLPRSSDNLSFPLSKIGLFRADDMGAARELIFEWEVDDSDSSSLIAGGSIYSLSCPRHSGPLT